MCKDKKLDKIILSPRTGISFSWRFYLYFGASSPNRLNKIWNLVSFQEFTQFEWYFREIIENSGWKQWLPREIRPYKCHFPRHTTRFYCNKSDHTFFNIKYLFYCFYFYANLYWSVKTHSLTSFLFEAHVSLKLYCRVKLTSVDGSKFMIGTSPDISSVQPIITHPST